MEEREGRGCLGWKHITTHSAIPIFEEDWMEEANNINFIPSFHQPQNKKINLFLF
jgi:hypothetical protein